MTRRNYILFCLCVLSLISAVQAGFATEVMSPTEIWEGYNPREEPLDEEILRSWEEDGITYKEVYFNGEKFNGKYVRIYAIYAAPTGGKQLPGLVHIHGGDRLRTKVGSKSWLGVGMPL